MAEHSELVSEMGHVEKLSTQDRLKHAKKRRMQQLKKWSNRERELKKRKNEQNNKAKKGEYKVHFVPSVMLLEAAARNDIDEVRRLLMLGVGPDSTNEDGLTALHQCCIDDSEDMMKLLIEFGANVNATDSEQWTPLHAAATCGHLHLVKYLISKCADLLSVNADGNMPYDICEDESTLDCIESEMAKQGITQEMIDETRAATEKQMLHDLKDLVDSGGDLEVRDMQGATPLHIAAANGYIAVVEFLLDHHVSTDVCDNDLWQPIHAAACWGHPEAIEMLVQSGADVSARTKNGETPYDICEDPELKERILQLKNEIETKRASQPQKLRRSHSQNTRSQSVRRTSIREKSQLPRREAREEARMRHEKQDTNDDDDEAKVQQDAREFEKCEFSDFNDSDCGMPVLPTHDTLSRIKGKSRDYRDLNSETDNALSDNVENALVIENTEITKKGSHSNTEAQSLTLPGNHTDSVKVEIHVTVNTSPTFPSNNGTLADLKKHRSRNRNSVSLSSSSSSLQDLQRQVVYQNGHQITSTYTYQQPPSPSVSLQKFKGDPTEIVGDPRKQGCCSIM